METLIQCKLALISQATTVDLLGQVLTKLWHDGNMNSQSLCCTDLPICHSQSTTQSTDESFESNLSGSPLKIFAFDFVSGLFGKCRSKIREHVF